MALLPFRIDTTNPGAPVVEVDGVDVSDQVRALRLDCAPGTDLPVLTLELRPGAGPVEGAAEIQTVATDLAGTVRAFLAQLDPNEVQQAALNNHDMSRGLGAAMFAEIARLAGAHPWT